MIIIQRLLDRTHTIDMSPAYANASQNSASVAGPKTQLLRPVAGVVCLIYPTHIAAPDHRALLTRVAF
jgi:hypothetical protein